MSDHEIRLGDCLDPVTGLASLPDKSVDVCIMDPPYSAHVHANGRRGSSLTRGHGALPAEAVSQRRPIEFAHLTDAVRNGAAAEIARVVWRWVVAFSDVESAHLWRESLETAGLDYVRTGLWHRIGGAPQFTGDRPAQCCEAIIIAHTQGPKRWNGGGSAAFYAHSIAAKSEEVEHTTQKPLPLMEALIADFTDPGELVLDPFAGSGTTGVACKRLGRRFLGWERDPKYHAIAEKRIAAAREQFSLFAKDRTKPKQAALLEVKP